MRQDESQGQNAGQVGVSGMVESEQRWNFLECSAREPWGWHQYGPLASTCHAAWGASCKRKDDQL